MTYDEIKTFYEDLIGDTTDATTTAILANSAYNQIIIGEELAFFKTTNNALNTAIGDTYLTSYNLPTDFLAPLIPIGRKGNLYVGTEPKVQSPYEEWILYRENSDKWTIDYVNEKFYIAGTQNQAQTITLPYFKSCVTLATGVTPEIPAVFHPLIAYVMAGFALSSMQDIGGDNIELQLSAGQMRAAQSLLSALRLWDARIKVASIGGKSESDYNVGRERFSSTQIQI